MKESKYNFVLKNEENYNCTCNENTYLTNK